MPTAAKLVAALMFAAVGWAAAEAFMPLIPERTQWGAFQPICAALGLLCGWRVMGPRAGRGWSTAIGVGLSTAAVLLGVALLLFSGREMILRSLDRRYGDALEATVGTFGIMLENAALMADVRFLGTLLLGGIVSGLASEAAGRIWR